ncbi:hypothetical protein GEMRC1_004071 [Eukaryota sp. GEM-RC1]
MIPVVEKVLEPLNKKIKSLQKRQERVERIEALVSSGKELDSNQRVALDSKPQIEFSLETISPLLADCEAKAKQFNSEIKKTISNSITEAFKNKLLFDTVSQFVLNSENKSALLHEFGTKAVAGEETEIKTEDDLDILSQTAQSLIPSGDLIDECAKQMSAIFGDNKKVHRVMKLTKEIVSSRTFREGASAVLQEQQKAFEPEPEQQQAPEEPVVQQPEPYVEQKQEPVVEAVIFEEQPEPTPQFGFTEQDVEYEAQQSVVDEDGFRTIAKPRGDRGGRGRGRGRRGRRGDKRNDRSA